jgi:hypothetical protein
MVKQIPADVGALSVHREARVRVVLVTAPHEEMSVHKVLFARCRISDKFARCRISDKYPTQRFDGITDYTVTPLASRLLRQTGYLLKLWDQPQGNHRLIDVAATRCVVQPIGHMKPPIPHLEAEHNTNAERDPLPALRRADDYPATRALLLRSACRDAAGDGAPPASGGNNETTSFHYSSIYIYI